VSGQQPCTDVVLFDLFRVAVGDPGEAPEHDGVEDDGGDVLGVHRPRHSLDHPGSGRRLHRNPRSRRSRLLGDLVGVEQQLLEPVPLLALEQQFQKDKQGTVV
jgi:hypothetical protein